MAFLGGVFGIGFGKLIFGGLGQNVFNPALLGRAFLQAAFPAAITTWPRAGRRAGGPARRQLRAAADERRPRSDVVTAATPLGLMKFEHAGTDLALDLLVGSTGGSLGETAALLILLGGALPGLEELPQLAHPGRASWPRWRCLSGVLYGSAPSASRARSSCSSPAG